MAILSTCPKCAEPVTVPDGLEPTEAVRCPHCEAEFPLQEALDVLPPALAPVHPHPPETAFDPGIFAADAPPEAVEETPEVAVWSHDEPAPDDLQTDLDTDTEENIDTSGLDLTAAAEEPPAFTPSIQAGPERKRKSALREVIGAIVGGFFGLLVGYYLLCWLGAYQVWGLERMDLPKLPLPYLPHTMNAPEQPAPDEAAATEDNASGWLSGVKVTEPPKEEPKATPEKESEATPKKNPKEETPKIPKGEPAFESDEPEPTAGALPTDQVALPEVALSIESPASKPAKQAKPEPKREPKPEPKPETKPETKPEPKTEPESKPSKKALPADYVGPKDPPSYTAAEWTAAWKDAQSSLAKGLSQSAYRKLARLGETLAFVEMDEASRSEHVEKAESLLKKVGGSKEGRSKVARLASIVLAAPHWPEPGVLITGVVKGTGAKNGLHGAVVDLPVYEKTLTVFSDKPFSLAKGDEVLVLGRIVKQPKEQLIGYSGSQSRILWAAVCVKVESP